jgi:hypothetical protein
MQDFCTRQGRNDRPVRNRPNKDLARLGNALGGISLFCEDVCWVESAGRGQIADPAKAMSGTESRVPVRLKNVVLRDLIVLCECDLTFRAYHLDKLAVYVAHADIVNGAL